MNERMLNKAIDLIYQAKQHKIEIVLNEEQLQLKLPKNTSIDKNLLQELKENKQLIIDFLRNNSRNTKAQHKITPFDRAAVPRIPLSFSQERLWFIDRMEGSVQYHMPVVLRLKGKLNIPALEFALKTIIGRHEILRTVYLEKEGNCYQSIREDKQWKLDFIEGAGFADDPAGLQKLVQQLVNKPFDLSNDFVLRATLIILNQEEYLLPVTTHHIASDGWSLSVLVHEVVELYKSFEEGTSTQLIPLELQYADFAVWQRNFLNDEALDNKLSYWKKKLQDVTPVQLPTDFPRPPVWGTQGAISKFIIDKDLFSGIQGLSNQQGSTMFMTMLAAFKVLLFRYTGQEDICVGTPIAGRLQKELDSLIGFFVNTLALRSTLHEDAIFSEVLSQVRTTTLDAYEHQEVPFEKVVDTVLNERDLSRSPLVQIMFALNNTPQVPDLRLGDVQLMMEGAKHTTTHFDLSFMLTQKDETINVSVEYSTNIYTERTIARMISHYKELLSSIIKEPKKRISELTWLTTAEEHQLLVDFNNTALVVPANKTIIDLFEAIAKKTPDATALICEEEKLTYQELNERSNQLAHYLKTKGVKGEVLVPVCLKRSIDLIVSLLAILKAGGVYVPVDPAYPEERIRYMLEDTAAHIVISNNTDINLFDGGEGIEVISPVDSIASINEQPVTNLGTVVIPGQLANVIYTSGSTGKPKGVMIEHAGLMNLVEWHNATFKVSAASNSTTMAGVGFDAFGWEIWPYLSIGASLLIIDDDARLSTTVLMDLFNKHHITHSFIATALVTEFVQASEKNVPSLEFLLTGGDRLPSVDIGAIGYVLVNNYGPTENSVVSTSYSLRVNDTGTAPPIGTPIANTQLYIVNTRDRLVPVGVAGELCISGASLARGYLNLPALTEEKFVLNPFSLAENVRMYRTGDICRWLPDGNIEYLGRKDEQVKIRGYRIELGEIENVLQQCELVSQAIVLSKEITQGDKRLFGYFVPSWESVKAKELELYRTQIAGWKELYENEYGQTEGEAGIDVEFNIIGWNDSFTKEPIPAEEMADWVRDIVEVIMSKRPVNVLEIGSGTGLIYYQLAGKLKKYIGTDFSKSSISQIAHQISKGARDYGDTELQVCAAHEIELDETEQIDTIILNSIVQYFPGEDYMSTVIEKGISILKGNGRIIVGDVRDNRLLKYFKGRLHLLRAQQSEGIKEFNWILDQETLNEEELCFSPEYFYQLVNRYPQITHIEIEWKQSEFINELTLYRYTVIVYVGIQNEIIDPDWKNWEITAEREALVSLINEHAPIVALKDAPNPKLWKERQLRRSLQDKAIINAGDILMALEKEDAESIQIKELLKLAMDNGYRCRQLLDEDPMKVNILLELTPGDHFIRPVYGDNMAAAFNTNIPLFAEIMLMMQKDIRSHMERQLPDYMLPSELYSVGKLPLTNNGKVDKGFLNQLAGQAVVIQLNYKAPRTAMETTLAGIWKVLIGIDKVGIEDNFFELGGHSLMVMRLISAVRKELGLELAIKDLFLYPTITELANFLQTLGTGLSLPPVEAQVRPEHIPLSFGQERLWFVDRLEGSVPFHMPSVLKLSGELNREALRHALQTIVGRHEVLRTVFREADGIPYQYIKEKNGWELNITDWDSFSKGQDSLQDFIKNKVVAPFDLSEDYMLRADLIIIGLSEHILILTVHHIASDAWSTGILVQEVVELYKSFVEGRPALLPALAIQYADYAIWQRNYLTAELLNYKLNYWKEKLHGIEPLQIPTDFPRPPLQSTKGTSIKFAIDKQLAEQLKELSQQQESTMFMTLLAAFKVLLHRYSGQQDICIGTSIAGRQKQEIEDLIGFFVNILALRTPVDPAISFTGLLTQVKQTTLEAYEHQEVPFEKVVDAVVKDRDISRSPLFQVLFVMLNTPTAPETALGKLTLSSVGHKNTSSKYDITFIVTENEQGLSGSVEYSTELFTEETMNRMTTHFNELLHSIVSDPLQKVKDLNLLTKGEGQELLHVFNATGLDYPREKTIIELFELQVKSNSSAIAVMFEEEELTYGELDERANRLANYLLENGTRPGTNIGLLSYRSIEMIIGIFGILKAGCAYVPFNTEYPAERINYIIEDAGIEQIVYTSHELLQAAGLDRFSCFHVKDSVIAPATAPSVMPAIDSCVYIMFTSGTTGRPKGIAVSHRNISKLVHDDGPISVKPTDRVLQWSNYSFDGSTYDIYSSLLKGASICLIKDGWASDVDELSKVIASKNITVCFITTALFNTFVDVQPNALKGLRKILFGGEMVSVSHVKKALAILGEGRIVHVYGPTETTVYACSYAIDHISAGTGIPIGKPLSNTTFFVLNGDCKLVPVGVPGELFIGGEGVSLGYVNNPAITEERFIQNPFSENKDDRLYRTGDIVRWLPGGVIEYLSRIDDQVKIRGFRIELGEIESVLQECELVRHAAVLAKTDKEGTKRLVGYVVPTGEFDKQAIQAYLRNKLPDYMVPALLVEMESLPLNPNGKIDRKVLPDPEAEDLTSTEFVAPRNQHELVLANIWQDLLGLDEIGIHDNFFEIGGDSLLAIRVVSAVRKQLEIEMPISTLFEYQTIASLAGQLETQADTVVLPPVMLTQRPERIPLSFSQERLWFIDRLEGSLQYHIPAVMRLTGVLNRNGLEYTLSSLINRHEVLRTIFRDKDGDPYQFVKDKADWELPFIDGSMYENDIPGLQKLVKQLISVPFNLAKDNMLRANLVMLNEQEHVLVVTVHHIASDGWSRSILVKEVAELYTAFEEQREAVLAPLPIQYADFSIWQRSYLQGELLNKKLEYWQQKLQGLEPLQMPLDFPRPAIQTSRGASARFSFDASTTESLQKLSQQQGSTLFMTLLSALKVLLYRYSSQKDICVGTGVAGRQQQEVEGLIGFFVNTLALRTELNNGESFSSLLQKVRKTTLEAYSHQEVPFEKVVDSVITKRDRSRNPLFQVMFVLQNTPEVPNLKLGQLKLGGEVAEHTTAQFDLSFSITENDNGLAGLLEYNIDLYKAATINRLLGHFSQLINSIIQDPQKKISELAIMSAAEAQHVLLDLNANETVYPKDKTIVALFEEQVEADPEAIAVVFEDEKLTYRQLNEKANQLAHYLQANGVKEESLVAISIERSADMMVGILGILKAGGAYVPIDAEYPAERIQFMLEDTAARIVLTSNQVKPRLQVSDGCKIISLDGDRVEIEAHATTGLKTSINPGSLAYIIYTSGSTGRPKGVMVSQHNVVSLVKGVDYLVLTKKDVLLSTGSSSFDATTIEYWGMLLNGGQLILCSGNTLMESSLLKSEIVKQKVNRMWFTSSWFNQLVETHITLFEGLDTILVGGEKLSEHHIEKVRQTYPGIEIINGYGPTENTTFSLTYTIRETSIKSVIPIGRPLNNRHAYILDEIQQLVPVGVPGEICLGGAGLSKGYLNRPDLTAEKFVQNPFVSGYIEKIYKTGDIGRWLPDGNIEYLGRVDEQVKIRGYRIELGEIETVLQESGLVSHSVVVAWQGKEGNKSLVGYIVPTGLYNKNLLTSHLQSKLPDYMIPALWVELERLPLTSNGKVDKRALPDPDATEMLTNQYVAPASEMERKLVATWQEILRADRIGIHDNFFELGGHSLLAMRLISAVRKEMQIELAVKDLFMYPTVAELGNYLEEQKKGSLLPAIEAYPRPLHIPLSFSQERLWFIDQLEGSIPYNSPTVLRLKGKVDVEALTFALKNIISRHEVLRTVFYELDGKPFQKIKDNTDWQISLVDGLGYKEDTISLQGLIKKLISTPFNLSKDYMLRADLITLGENEYVLVVTMHHIASDGWSIPIIVREVVESYSAYIERRTTQLENLPLQYADYSIWQRKYLEGEVMDRKTAYWKRKLEDVPALQLPTDFKRPAIRGVNGASVHFKIHKELTDQLNLLSQQQGTTLFMTLLATYKILLSRYSGQGDICVGASIANRPQLEMEGLIGFFVNTLALRTEVDESATFIDLLKEVKNTTLEAYENQDVPFEKVVEEVVKERDASRTPLFQVMMVLLNTPEASKIGFGDVELSNEGFEINISKFDFTFHISQAAQGLSVTLVYNTDLYREDTILRLAGHFQQLLHAVVAEPGQSIELLQMLTEAEEQQLLVEFN